MEFSLVQYVISLFMSHFCPPPAIVSVPCSVFLMFVPQLKPAPATLYHTHSALSPQTAFLSSMLTLYQCQIIEPFTV